LDAASGLGGWIGRMIGPGLSVNRKAMRNLMLALPGKTESEYREIIRGMWDNLGRTFAEYPHLETIAQERMVSVGEEHLAPVIDHPGTACILFT
ncbi:hypothetical protein ACI3RH_14365, partial [Lactococcus lactis]